MTKYSNLNQVEEGLQLVEVTDIGDPCVLQAVVVKEDVQAPPPGSVAGGGVWGSNVHFGTESGIASGIVCLLCGWIPSIIVCCLPFDKRRAYKVNRKIYDSRGVLIGQEQTINFQEGEPSMTVDSEQRSRTMTIAGVTGGVIGLLFVLKMLGSGAIPVGFENKNHGVAQTPRAMAASKAEWLLLLCALAPHSINRSLSQAGTQPASTKF